MTEDRLSHLEFISAAAAVYAWVSASDGTTTNSEIEGFIEYLVSLEYVDEISSKDFEELYANLIAAFENDFEDGKNRAIARIEPFKGDKTKSEELIRVARKSLCSDGKTTEAEEVTLAAIAEILNIAEGQLL